MQFYAVFICFTAKSLYMFRVSPAPIIRSTQTVDYNPLYKSLIWRRNYKIRLKRVHGRAAVAARPWTLFKRIL